jgi:hypothetical protein
MHKITTKDFPHLDFGDVRRNQRFVTIVDNLSTHPGNSTPSKMEVGMMQKLPIHSSKAKM